VLGRAFRLIELDHLGQAGAEAKHKEREDLVDLPAVGGERQQQALRRHRDVSRARVLARAEERALLLADDTVDALDEGAIIALGELVDVMTGGIAAEGRGDRGAREAIAPAPDASVGDMLGDQQVRQEPRDLRGIDVGPAGHASRPALSLPIRIELPVQRIVETIGERHRILGPTLSTVAENPYAFAKHGQVRLPRLYGVGDPC
jgi:hypothetical protein